MLLSKKLEVCAEPDAGATNQASSLNNAAPKTNTPKQVKFINTVSIPQISMYAFWNSKIMHVLRTLVTNSNKKRVAAPPPVCERPAKAARVATPKGKAKAKSNPQAFGNEAEEPEVMMLVLHFAGRICTSKFTKLGVALAAAPGP